MKIAFITDLHFGLRIKDVGSLLEYQLDYLEGEFIPYLVENKIDTLIIPGDISHTRKYVQTDTFYWVKKRFFSLLETHNIKTYIIPGNHDSYYTTSSEIHAGYYFEDYRNVTVIHEPTFFDIGGKKLLLTPWLSNAEDKKDFYAMLNVSIDCIVGHFEFNGFEIVPGAVMDHGDESALIKSKAQLIISGHFHNKSIKDNIVYIGTPYQQTWNEYGYDKGFHLLDTDTMQLEMIKNEGTLFEKVFYDGKEEIDLSIYKDKILKVYLKEEVDDKVLNKFTQDLDSIALKYSIIDVTDKQENTDIDDIKDKTIDQLFNEYTTINYPDEAKSLKTLYEKLQNHIL